MPRAELILIDRFVVDAAIVVGGAGAGRQRIAMQAAQRATGSMPLDGNACCRETALRAGTSPRRRIVDHRHAAGDRLGEDALPLQQRRHRRDHRAADGLPLPLVVGEEERPVASDRPAEHAAELVAAELAAWSPVGREVVARVQRFVAEELEDAAAEACCCPPWWSG